MKLRIALAIVGCALLVGAAPAPEDEKSSDWTLLSGNWQPTLMEIDGNKLPPDEAKEFLVIMSKGKYAAKRSGETIDEGTATIDQTKKPKEMDLKAGVGEQKGKVRKCIYEVTKDTMKFVIAQPDKDRPTKFESPAGSGCIYMEYKRTK